MMKRSTPMASTMMVSLVRLSRSKVSLPPSPSSVVVVVVGESVGVGVVGVGGGGEGEEGGGGGPVAHGGTSTGTQRSSSSPVSSSCSLLPMSSAISAGRKIEHMQGGINTISSKECVVNVEVVSGCV